MTKPMCCGTCKHSAKRTGSYRKNDLICLKHAFTVSSDHNSVPMPCGMNGKTPRGWEPKDD